MVKQLVALAILTGIYYLLCETNKTIINATIKDINAISYKRFHVRFVIDSLLVKGKYVPRAHGILVGEEYAKECKTYSRTTEINAGDKVRIISKGFWICRRFFLLPAS